ncbi:MAG: VanZ family protein [Chlorobi bacterium]|nr:VanZ family protein [Chlorobiota bacterium]
MSQWQIWHYFLPALVVSLGIFFTSAQPITGSPLFPFADKLYHSFVYAIYGSTVAFAMFRSCLLQLHQQWLAIAQCIVFATLDELHQMFVPGRTADFHDWCFDVIGAIVGITIYIKKTTISALTICSR